MGGRKGLIFIGLISPIIFFQGLAQANPSCKAGEHWVASHFRRAYKRYDGVRVKATQVKGHCRKNPRGYEKWHQRLSNSRPKIWGNGKEKSKKWSAEDLQRVLDAISVLPNILIDLNNVNIYRMSKSILLGNPATSNYSDKVLYDSAFQHKDSLAQILAHELAHSLFEKLSANEKRDFWEAADWVEYKRIKNALTAKKSKKFIQPDSRVSISEDFSNHIEHYLFKNESLKRDSPKAHQWIKKKFGQKLKLKIGVIDG